jgi:GH15 family glucan-1,4-alpha-glucosidase
MNGTTGPLSAGEISDTVSWIASVQLPNGMIPWFPGGHADPWNHTESAMALVVAGRRQEAERAFGWLAASQQPDGTWCRYHLAEGIEDPRRDPNVGIYVATGAWWYYLCTEDLSLMGEMWRVIEKAVDFALRLQQPGGEVLWSMDPDGHLGRYALLTSTSSILHSLRCAVAIAERLGHERPEWELAADRIVEAIVHRPGSFAPKDRWAMDWYYPILSGALSGEQARRRIDGRWSEFVLDGVGVRCVSDQPWVTAAETAECVMALDAIGMGERAATLLEWTRHLRDDDGAYWTGCVHPECVRFPGHERSTYTAAAVVLADHALYGWGRSAGLFRGETLPGVVDVAGITEPLGEG